MDGDITMFSPAMLRRSAIAYCISPYARFYAWLSRLKLILLGFKVLNNVCGWIKLVKMLSVDVVYHYL